MVEPLFFESIARRVRRALAAGGAAILLSLAPEPGFAQPPPQDEMQSRASAFSVDTVRADEDVDPNPVPAHRLEVHPLFTAEIRVDIALEGRCYYFLEDPCFFLEGRLIDHARQTLLPEAMNLLGSMLDERGVAEKLRQSIAYRMRQELLKKRNEGRPPNGPSHDPVCSPECPYSEGEGCVCPPRSRSSWWQIALGSGLLAAGAVVGFSKNEWTPDEGWIGGIAGAAGIWIMSRQVVLAW